MNEEDLSDVFKKISSMLNSSNTSSCESSSMDTNNSENLNWSEECSNKSNFENVSSEDSSSNSNCDSFFSGSTSDNNDFNIDLETILKVKSMMDKMNNLKNNARSNLLLSLKPYLNEKQKEKVDMYIKLFNIGDAFGIFDNYNIGNGSDVSFALLLLLIA